MNEAFSVHGRIDHRLEGGAGAKTVTVFRKHGISAASVDKYTAKYRGMDESIPAK